jgi:predicted metal-dependent phosphoesterase TrpH
LNVDLHIHTKESDGRLTVEEVLRTASQCGLKYLAITDHETTRGVEEAQETAYKYGLEVIPGVELNTVYKGEEIHLLGYYRTVRNDLLQERLRQIRKERSDLARLMVQKLCQNNIRISWEQVEENAGQDGVICKSHIIYALTKQFPEAGQIDWNQVANCLNPGGRAYILYGGNPFTTAVDFIYTTGGLPVLAHPGLIRNQALIEDLLAYRPIGLEVYYGYWEHKEELIAFFENIARRSAILATGGSDYHGFFSPVGIGQVDVPEKCVLDLQNYLNQRNS